MEANSAGATFIRALVSFHGPLLLNKGGGIQIIPAAFRCSILATALFGPIFVPFLMTQTFRAKFFQFHDMLISFAMIRAVTAAFIFVWRD